MTAPQIAPLGRILRAEEVGLYRDAEAALRAAEAAVGAMHARAAQEAEAACAARLAAAAQEMQRETARILIETEAAAQRSLAAMPCEIAEAIAEGVAKVIGGIDLAEAVARAAQRAMAELAKRHAVVVRVNPAALGRTSARLDVRGNGVRVVADPALTPDACIIEMPAGFVRAGLEEQIATLRAALKAAACADG
jgi:flagellar biosynthesis/type III secretory pathway protein FliH